MKKLLTLLLTLVMAVSLINLNNSHTKAEGNAEDIGYTIHLKSDGTQLLQDNGPAIVPTDIASYDVATNTITIHKSITINSNVKSLLKVEKANTKIFIEGDVTLTGTDTQPIIQSHSGIDLNFVGDGFNTLTVVNNHTEAAIASYKGISFTKLNADVTSAGNTIYFGIQEAANLTLDNFSKIKVTTTDANKKPILAKNVSGEPTAYSKMGHGSSPSTMAPLIWDNGGYYKTDVHTSVDATYVELNNAPLYEYKDTGWGEYHTKNIYSEGDGINIKNSSSSNITLTTSTNSNGVIVPGGSDDLVIGTNEKGVVNFKGTTINVASGVPTSCEGLIYHTDNYWYKDYVAPENKLDDAGLAAYGIVKNADGSYTFNKSLTINNTKWLLQIDASVNIIIGNDISLTNTASSPSSLIVIESDGVKIDGQGHKLVLNVAQGNASAFSNSYQTTLKDIELIAENNSNPPTIYSGNNIKLEGDCKIEAINQKDTSFALRFDNNAQYDFVFSGNYVKKGSATQKNQSEEDVHLAKDGTNKGRYVVGSGDDTLARYVRITKMPVTPEPTPTPSPSEPVVKDESCEKVIGPTWHWNNDKGICEEVGVVGTSTR